MNKEPVKTDITCDCGGWKNGADQIFAAQIRDTLRTGVKYTGGMFTFCPWCGKKLAVVEVAKAAGREES